MAIVYFPDRILWGEHNILVHYYPGIDMRGIDMRGTVRHPPHSGGMGGYYAGMGQFRRNDEKAFGVQNFKPAEWISSG